MPRMSILCVRSSRKSTIWIAQSGAKNTPMKARNTPKLSKNRSGKKTPTIVTGTNPSNSTVCQLARPKPGTCFSPTAVA